METGRQRKSASSRGGGGPEEEKEVRQAPGPGSGSELRVQDLEKQLSPNRARRREQKGNRPGQASQNQAGRIEQIRSKGVPLEAFCWKVAPWAYLQKLNRRPQTGETKGNAESLVRAPANPANGDRTTFWDVCAGTETLVAIPT